LGRFLSALKAGIPGESVPTTAATTPGGDRWALAGVWKGDIAQSDGLRYPVRVVVSGGSAAPSASAEYPTLQCAGAWTFQRLAGASHVFIERITAGRHSCVDGTVASISAGASGELNVSMEFGAIRASGVLVREASAGASVRQP
jgi:hypothetical protein